ncbi:MAG: hypothetical protein GX437_07635 [Sphingobacteriales bacterium]|nr:hypothetical protein [Sphingobacteriales bacterium]
MDKLGLKTEIIEKCMVMLQEKFKIHEAEMKEAQNAANEAGPPKDRYDPYRSQMLRKRNLLAEQCQQVLDELEILKKINPVVNDKVMFGSVVITNLHRLFIAVPLGKVEVQNEVYHVISVHTPLFEALKNKKAGDPVIFNQNKILIADVF